MRQRSIRMNEITKQQMNGNKVDRREVERIVKQFVNLPMGAIIDNCRELLVGHMISQLRINEEDGGIYYQSLLKNRNRTVGDYLLAYCDAVDDMGSQNPGVIMQLGAISDSEPWAVERFEDEAHTYNMYDEGYGDDPAVEACSVDELEAADMLPADMLQWLQVDKEAMDELFDTVTLPFLRLPIVAYLDYLNTIPELAKLNLYEAWFRRDVEAWREQYRSEPTIADVLYRSIERFKVIADDWDRQFCLMSEEERQALDDQRPVKQPFARCNRNGCYWPPEEADGALAGTRIYLLMVQGLLCVLKAQSESSPEVIE